MPDQPITNPEAEKFQASLGPWDSKDEYWGLMPPVYHDLVKHGTSLSIRAAARIRELETALLAISSRLELPPVPDLTQDEKVLFNSAAAEDCHEMAVKALMYSVLVSAPTKEDILASQIKKLNSAIAQVHGRISSTKDVRMMVTALYDLANRDPSDIEILAVHRERAGEILKWLELNLNLG